jgi:general secretion pathway protein I
VRGSSDAARAALYAQSLLAQVGTGEAIVAGQRDGEFEEGRYRWQLRIAPWRDRSMAAAKQQVDPNAARLFEITLAMQWGDAGPGKQLQLRSLRMAAAGSGEAALP